MIKLFIIDIFFMNQINAEMAAYAKKQTNKQINK